MRTLKIVASGAAVIGVLLLPTGCATMAAGGSGGVIGGGACVPGGIVTVCV